VQVIGASVDRPEANRRWAEKHDLRMPLLSDTDHVLVAAFGVERPTGTAERSTWLIDAEGSLRRIYPKVSPKGHAAAVLSAVRELWG
jgi:peroxiredoxin Q/BCP